MVLIPTPRMRGRVGTPDALRRLLPWLFVTLGVLLLLPTFLAEGGVTEGAPQLDGLRWCGGFLVVAGLLMGLPTLLRLHAASTTAGPRRIEVLEVRPLAPRRSLVLVKVEGQTLLVGSSEAGLTSLGRIDTSPRGTESRAFDLDALMSADQESLA